MALVLKTKDATEKTRLIEEHNNENDVEEKKTLKRELSLGYCISFLLNGLIGAGFFISPALIAKNTPNSFVALALWISAAFISLLGSLCYCELTSVVKKTGSTFIIVYEAYGKFAGFMILWTILTMLSPFGFNVLLQTCGNYICSSFIEDKTTMEYIVAVRVSGFLLFFFVAAISCIGIKEVGRVQTVVTVVQVVTVSSLAIAGIYNISNGSSARNFKADVIFNNTISGIVNDLPSFGAGFFSALYAFDGWFMVSMFAEEIKNPKRNLPIVAAAGLPLAGLFYIIVHLSCLTILSHEEMGSTKVLFVDVLEKTGIHFAKYIVPVVVVISCCGAMFSGMYYFSRFVLSAAREGMLPKVFSLFHSKRGTPIPAIMLICITTTICAVSGVDAENALQFFNIAIWFEYGLAFTTIFYLRYKRPGAPRIYRVWIITPIFLLFVAITLIILIFIRLPISALFFAITILTATIVYFLCIRGNYMRFLKIDQCSDWIVEHTNLVVNEFVDAEW